MMEPTKASGTSSDDAANPGPMTHDPAQERETMPTLAFEPRPCTEYPPSMTPLTTVWKKSGPSDARANNRMMVFSQLFPHQMMSRADIGRNTGLSKASVSDVVSEMLDTHIIAEIGLELQNGRGKRGTLLAVDARHWSIVTIDLSQPSLIQGAVTNLVGLVVRRMEVVFDEDSPTDPDTVTDLCGRLIAEAPGQVLGIGVAVPGIVDRDGTVLRADSLDWRNVPLGTMLRERFSTAAVIDNDARSALLAERFFGRGTPNTMFVQIDSGVRASLLVDDAIACGIDHLAGDIGHVVIDDGGPPCRCGRGGCLEAFSSAPAVRRRIEEGAGRVEALAASGDALARALAMPVALLDIHDVAVYGPTDVVNDAFLDSVSRGLAKRRAWPSETDRTVRRSECGTNILIRGESISVCQAMLRTMSAPTNDKDMKP